MSPFLLPVIKESSLELQLGQHIFHRIHILFTLECSLKLSFWATHASNSTSHFSSHNASVMGF